jgi:hypothetical protein
MKTKTTPDKPATKTASTPTAVEDNSRPTISALEEAFEQLYKSAFGVLIEIRDRKLFAPAFDSFAEYGAKRWRERVRSLAAGDLAPFRPIIGPDRNAPKAPKVKKTKAAPAPAVEAPTVEEPPTHLPKDTTLAQAVGLAPAPVEAPAEPAKKTAKKKLNSFQRTLKRMEKAGAVPKPGVYRAAEQVKAKAESLGQLRNRARMAKGETKIKLVAQIAREHGAAAAADLVPGLATEIPGVNNLPAVGVTA